jgi:hypothetical protein
LRRILCFVFLLAGLLTGANAQTSHSAYGTAGAAGKLSGVVSDPSGAVIPGATIHVERRGPLEAQIPNVISDAGGRYTVTLPPGAYDVTVIADGFEPFLSTVTISLAGGSSHLNAALTILTANEQVNVFSNQNSTSAGDNKSALVFGSAELATLSDNDSTFQQQIEAIAGADPTQGASIYVDGFSGGQMPPKDSIREIRINQNPYSPQYPELGYGRIEIFTKPGSDKLHGHLTAFANKDSFNAQNPFPGPQPPDYTVPPQPPYYMLFMRGDVSGPIGKKTSFFVSSLYYDMQNNSVINAITPSGNYNAVVPSPTTNVDQNIRLDRQVTASNVFTVRYEVQHSSQPTCGLAGCVAPFGNGPPAAVISSQVLPSEAFSNASTTQTLQLSDSQNIGKNKILETRFQWIRAHMAQSPVSTAPTETVEGFFSQGGAPSQQASDHTDQIEFQEYFSLEHGKHFFRVGGRYHGYRDANSSRAGFNGAFTYAPTTVGTTTTSALMNYPKNPSQYDVTVGAAAATVYTGDLGVYADDEWRARKNVTLNYGLRVESQSAIPDHFDPAPRLGASWAIGQTDKHPPVVTLRAGFGLFYDRFLPSNILTAIRQQSGTLQQHYVVTDVDPSTCSPTTPQPCTGLTATPPTLYSISPHLRSEYQVIGGISAERMIGKMGKVSVNYLHSQSDHVWTSLNINAPLAGTYVAGQPGSGVRPLGGTQNIYQFASVGSQNMNMLFANTQLMINKHVSYWAYFRTRCNNGDSSGAASFPTNQYDLHADYGRIASATTRLFNGADFTLPWGVTLGTFIVFATRQPFNITIGNDLNGDTQFNDRPSFATVDCGTCQTLHTAYGVFHTTPQPGEKIIPINYGNGPRFFTTQLTLSKSFRWGTRPAAPLAPKAVDGKPAPKAELPPKPYELRFNAEVDNVLNHPNDSAPVGVLTSPDFGKVLALNSAFIGSPNANRMIYIGTSFSF